MQFAPGLWGIPVVASATDRAVQFQTPQVNQRVHNLQTGNIELWDGTQWLTSIAVKLDITQFGAVGDNVTDNAAAFQRASDAVNAVATSSPVTLTFPDGVFYYTSGLAFTREVTLTGTGTLNYGGTGIAVKMGADGVLDAGEPTNRHFIVEGLTFIGGALMTYGIYFNTRVTQPRVHKCVFYQFGGSGTWAIFGQSSNWDMLVTGCRWVTNSNSTGDRNFVKANGYDTGGTTDQGQSRLRVYHCLATEQGFGAGVAIWMSGVNSEAAHNKIEGFAVNVHIGARATRARVVDNYFETTKGTECIRHGDPTGPDAGSFCQYLQVRGNYCNLHNDDAYATTASFIGPGNSSVGIQFARVRDNDITGLDSGRALIRQNNNNSQNGNVASGNSGHAILHTSDTNIAFWTGDDERFDPYLINQDSRALKHDQYQGGITVNAGATTDFVLSWTTQFFDANITPVLSLYDNNSGSPSAAGAAINLTYTILSWDATGITVRVHNPTGADISAGFAIIAIHE